MEIMVRVDPSTCIGCGDCEEGCPVDVFSLENGISEVVHLEQCGYCQYCATICPTDSIEVECQINS